MLKELLSYEQIKAKVDVKNWEEALQEAGNLLVASGKVTDKYVQNMIDSIREFGPYIVIMPGIAFGHARPDESVIDNCFSIITLKNKIEFGHDQNDPVEIVFAFAAKDSNNHLEAIQDLGLFLMEEENVEFLKQAQDSKEILDYMLEKLK